MIVPFVSAISAPCPETASEICPPAEVIVSSVFIEAPLFTSTEALELEFAVTVMSGPRVMALPLPAVPPFSAASEFSRLEKLLLVLLLE